MMADVGADRLDPARNLTPAAGQCPIGEPTRAGPAPLPAAGQVDAVHRMPERGFARNQFLADPGAPAKACVVEQRVGRRQPHRGQPLMSGRTPSERRAGAAPGTGVQHLSLSPCGATPDLDLPFRAPALPTREAVPGNPTDRPVGQVAAARVLVEGLNPMPQYLRMLFIEPVSAVGRDVGQ